MAKNKLFVPITLRFSLINDQHVEVMNMLDELAETDKRSKNQIVMDALEYYFRQGTDEETSSQTYIDTAAFESRLSEEREKLRLEIYQDVIRFIAGSALSGGVKTVIMEPEGMEIQGQKQKSEDYEEFGDNGVMMKDVMKWS